jgi:hypothetical protein
MRARIRGPLEQCHLVRFLLYQLSYIPNSLLNLRYNIICFLLLVQKEVHMAIRAQKECSSSAFF